MASDTRMKPESGDRFIGKDGRVRVVENVDVRPNSLYSRVYYRRPTVTGALGSLRSCYLTGWQAWAKDAQHWRPPSTVGSTHGD